MTRPQNQRAQTFIDAMDTIWNRGATPTIMVDATREDVTGIPESIRKQRGAQTPIELKASYPLRLVYTEQALECDLAFSGATCRCVLPWASVWAVHASDSDRSLIDVVYASYIGVEVEPREGVRPPPPQRPKLSVIKGGKS